MKTRAFTGILVAAVAMLATPAVAQTVDFSVPVDDSFAERTFTYNDGRKGYRYKWRVGNVNGFVAHCGVGHFGYSLSAPHERRAMRETSLMINGKSAIKDFSFFREVPSRAALNVASAYCKVSDMRVPAGEASVHIDFPGIRFRD